MFKSYSQNFEDVILWRALGHVERGFYIDVGAQHPTVDSVSKAFYESGWIGIHAEASKYYAEMLQRDRPNETVIHAAIGDGGGTIKFFEIADTGLSTGDPRVAEMHKSAGRTLNEVDVVVKPLSELFKVAGDREIHWLKIDVEGMEATVINSWSPSQAKPWVVVVEATEPNTQIPSHDAWEDTLLGQGYIFAYFDGLSRFYVSNDHVELLHHFGPGPNFFDNFVLADTSAFVDNSERDQAYQRLALLNFENPTSEINPINENNIVAGELSGLRSQVRELTANRESLAGVVTRLEVEVAAQASLFSVQSSQLEEKIARISELENSLRKLEVDYDLLCKALTAERDEALENANREEVRSAQIEAAFQEIINSNSWRITAPLRRISLFLQKFSTGMSAWIRLVPGSRPRRTARLVLAHLILWIRQRPVLAAAVLSVLIKFPGLGNRVRGLYRRQNAPPSWGELEHGNSKSSHSSYMSPRALVILAEIDREMGRE